MRIILIISIFLLSCRSDKTKEWHTLNFGEFTLKTPPDWKVFKESGIDSYVGGLSNGKDSLFFDLGWYSSELYLEDGDNSLFAQDTINGKIAVIKIPKNPGTGTIELSIPNVTKNDKFHLGGSNINNTEMILKIFKSIRFKGSDTSANGSLELSKFKEFPHGSGETLFVTYCAPCHKRNKEFSGPALTSELLNSRSNEWLYTFLLDRKNLKIDSAYKARFDKFSPSYCPEHSNFSKHDVEQLFSYLKN